jgi:pimeloyl-ACP methyl ester carboxylesterase/ribosomal protein S18 acetylase RimI-like enzyme
VLEYRQLSRSDIPHVERHLLSLSPEDRYSRYRQVLSDTAIVQECQRTNPSKDLIVGCFSGDTLIGMAQTHMYSENGFPVGELALTVDVNHRRKSIGRALIMHSQALVKLRGICDLYIYTIKGNRAMVALARKFGSNSCDEDGEVSVRFIINERRFQTHKRHFGGVNVFESTSEQEPNLVVLLHGAGGDAWQWRQHIAPALRADGLGVSLVGVKSWANIAHLTQTIEELCIESGKNIILVGHSLGGLLAQHIAARGNIPKLSKLVLVCALPLQNHPKSIHHASNHVDQGSLEDLRLAQSFDFGVSVKITVPVSIVSGLGDKVCPIEVQRSMARDYNACMTTINSGHNPITGSQWPLVAHVISN